jgi:hypothetical protein
MGIVKNISFILLTISSIEGIGQAASVFTVTPTGSNHTIFIEKAASPSVNGEPLRQGDLIGVFFDTPGGLECGGFTEWNNQNTFITAYGADETADGFKPGEVFKYKIWRSATNCIIDKIDVTYETGGIILNTDSFEDNGISKIGMLNATDYLVEENFKVWVTDANCRTGGKILVISRENEALDGVEIIAKCAVSRDEYRDFTEIVELKPDNYLLLITRQGCSLAWPEPISVIKDSECEFPVISPDGDGNAEDYYIPYQGKAKIYDRSGTLMAELAIPSTWDATDQAGNPLPMGTYVIVCDGAEDILITIVR